MHIHQRFMLKNPVDLITKDHISIQRVHLGVARWCAYQACVFLVLLYYSLSGLSALNVLFGKTTLAM